MNLMKKWLLISVLLGGTACSLSFAASSETPSLISLRQMPTQYAFSLESIQMPNRESNMVLLGASYQIKPLSWFYTGMVGFGAVRGQHGGLFVLGATAGLQPPIIEDMLVGDLGIDAGGGGGQQSGVGNGLMFRPHVGLLYNFGLFQLGVTYSKVKFPGGKIDNNQYGAELIIPTGLDYADPSYGGTLVRSIKDIDLKELGYLYFENFYLAPLIQNYFQASGTKDTGGSISDGQIGQAGIEAGEFLAIPHYRPFIFIKAGGAFHGDHNGYMDVLGGAGYRWLLVRSLFLNGRLAAGAGGGGNIDTGGGFLVQPSVGLEWQFSRHFSTELEGGYIDAPSGSFKAATATLKVIYSLQLGDSTTTKPSEPLISPELVFHTWRVQAANQTYFNAQRKTTEKCSTNLVELDINTYLNHYLYLTGQAGSAYTDKAGGYSTGMLGAGITSSTFWHDKFDVGLEMLGGAGGGGGMDVGGGFLLQPRALLEYYLTHYVSLNAGVGQVYAPRGSLNATTANVGIALHFSTLQNDG